jgi:hypothetical protein
MIRPFLMFFLLTGAHWCAAQQLSWEEKLSPKYKREYPIQSQAKPAAETAPIPNTANAQKKQLKKAREQAAKEAYFFYTKAGWERAEPKALLVRQYQTEATLEILRKQSPLPATEIQKNEQALEQTKKQLAKEPKYWLK